MPRSLGRCVFRIEYPCKNIFKTLQDSPSAEKPLPIIRFYIFIFLLLYAKIMKYLYLSIYLSLQPPDLISHVKIIRSLQLAQSWKKRFDSPNVTSVLGSRNYSKSFYKHCLFFSQCKKTFWAWSESHKEKMFYWE